MIVEVDRARIVRARYNKGMDVRTLSAKCGVPMPSLHSIERGAWQPNPVTLAKICKALDLIPGEVITMRDETRTQE